MRTGAIFARGSCRALEWMAVLGVVLALGVGQAAAQQDTTEPTFTSATFDPGSMTVLITMSEPVYGTPLMGDFVLSGAGTGNAVTAVAVLGSESSPSTEIMVTVSTAIPSGTSGASLAYTRPGVDAQRIKDVSGNLADTNSSITLAENDLQPKLDRPADQDFVEDAAIQPLVLTEATGGNGASYSYTLFEGANDLAATAGDLGLTFTPATRVLSGTPKTVGTYSLVYTATEAGDGSAVGGAADRVAVAFTVDVAMKGTTPTTGLKVTVKSVTAANVVEGGSLEVKVTAQLPAGEGATIPMREVMLAFPAMHDTIGDGEGAEDPGDFEVLTDTILKDIKLGEEKSEKTYTFRVEIRRDLDAEDEKFQVSARIDDDEPVKSKAVYMIDDAQTQKYTLSLPSAAKGMLKEGAADATTLTLKADPPRTSDIPVTLAVNPNDPTKYELSTLSSSMFGAGSNSSVTATIRALADKNRSDDEIMVTAYKDTSLDREALATVNITVTDADALPGIRATLVDDDGDALAPQPGSVMEGETLMLKLTAVDKNGDSMEAAEKLMVSLMAAGTAGVQDYRLSAHPIEIAAGSASSKAVDLMVLADDDVGEEMLVFDAVVSGDEKVGPGTKSVMGVLSLMIEDGTMRLVWAKSMEDVQKSIYDAKAKGAGADEVFSPGEMIEVDASTLFNYAPGVTLDYVGSTASDAVSIATSGKMVTVTGAKPGMAHVIITAHANAPAGAEPVPQSEPDEASIKFPVEVGLEALSIMLSGPEDMNLVEGMSAMVTATANRAVTADTKVMLMRDRAMSSASDADYTADAITIEAGEMSGSTMVMAVEDNMMENDGNMAEELVLYGMTEGMAGEVTGHVKLYLWDAAVPALPVIAQLLLAAFLALGGYRRYRRR